jgi:prepilin-type N-terminal cleavage/methylation domain-containing protein
MIKQTLNRGFTLIELLVVIAIIGILASVVLASLNSARDKGADAATKSNLNNIRAQAELVRDTQGDYDGVCDDTNVTQGVTAASGTCNDDAAAWAAFASLTASSTSYCVDSTGKAVTTSATIASTALVCP